MTSDPHEIYGNIEITVTEAHHILNLIQRGIQQELNFKAARLGLVTYEADAATVIKRLKNLAMGVIQQEERFNV